MNAGTTILEALFQATGQFVPASELHHRVPTAGDEIAQLRQLGYDIEVHPHFGYRLLAVPDRLTADDIQARLQAKPQVGTASPPRWSALSPGRGGDAAPTRRSIIGSEILVFDETSSTNDVVARLAHDGAREGLVVFAESQTRGRGRHGRTWVSPHGKGLWFSVLLRPVFPVAKFPRITVAAGVAVARAVDLNARIKWPNDVTVAGQKLAGILTEARDGAAILGIGIDVNCDRSDFPADVAATSLRIETGEKQDRAVLAAAVLTELDEYYRLAVEDFGRVTDEWARLSTTLGRQLVVRMGDRRIEGHAQALDGDGALLLRRDNGSVERILGADVMVERA